MWRERLSGISWVPLRVEDPAAFDRAIGNDLDAIVHLAAVSSGAEARHDPLHAWQVNCLGSVHLTQAMERAGCRARLLLVSTGEVYGRNLRRPARETDPLEPCSPYAASKAAAETAGLEFHRRVGADVVIVRPFAQIGPGQRDNFVVPAFARRIIRAYAGDAPSIPVGNLGPEREFLDVRDLAAALTLVVEKGETGLVYNVASGVGTKLGDLLRKLSDIIGWHGQAVPDQTLFRNADIPFLVGDAERLKGLGWTATRSLDDTLRDVVSEANEAGTEPDSSRDA